MRTLKFNKRYIAFPLSLLLFSPCAQADMFANVDWLANTDLSIGYNNNVNNGIKSDQIKEVMILSADISGSGFYVLEDGRTSVTVTGDVRIEDYNRYSGLNNNTLGVALGVRRKWGLGPYASWTALSLSSAYMDYSDPYRDGWRHQIAARAGKRIHERWELNAEIMVEQRTTDRPAPPRNNQTLSSDVFRTDSTALTLNAEYTWSERLFFVLGALYRDGDIVASTLAGGGNSIRASSTAIATDAVFGLNPDYIAYRMDGTTKGLNVDMKIALDHKNSLNISVARYWTHATSDNNYDNTVQMLSWIHNF